MKRKVKRSELIKMINNNEEVSYVDTSSIVDMSKLFWLCDKFNQDISKWDVSNVQDMNYMFDGCETFNQDISKWDVSNVIDKKDIFNKCAIKEAKKPKFW